MTERSLFVKFSATGDFPEIDYQLKMTIREAILKTLDYESFQYDAEVSVTLCDNEYIKSLNAKHRNKDLATDVLSFPMYDNGNFDPDECLVCATLGDIVISIPRAKEQAEELGNTFIREVAFLTIHSMLHLLGYDHERSAEDDEKQCRLQKEIISSMEF